ncbi:MAG: ABC transporter permease, partial [Planctomycetes bacterium]|nr:ABC transporter permease [Planctomycetota bacterium]
MRAGNVLRLGVKELWSVARDPMMLALIAFAFTVSIYAGATAMPESLNRAPIAVVDEDRSPLSERIVAAFQPPYFLPPERITRAEMDARMDAGLDTFALVIPSDFQRDVLAGRSPAVQLNVDATRINQAFNGSGYVQTIVNDEVQAFVRRYRASAATPADLAVRARFNPELNKARFGAVVKLIDNVTMLALILTGAALIRERERGTVEHLLVMPVTPFEIMTAKVWAMGSVVLVACGASLAVVVNGVMGVP